VKKADFSQGSFRWLTVTSPEEPDGTELQLALNDNPAANDYQQAMFEQSQPAAMFFTDDIKSDYERIKGRGAEFTMPPCPLVKRKELLRKILPKDNTGRVRFTDHITGSGERLFEKLEALQVEGMVMKRKDSVYSFNRCRNWLKVKTTAGRITMQKRIENWK
jgi:ATP dependent DNA ligase domain